MTARFSWRWMVSNLIILTVTTSEAFAHSIVEIRQNPSAFDQQTVTVTGEVANVVTRYGDASYTTFDLVNDKGATLSILVSQTPKCLQGDVCRVSGLFVAEKNVVLPEKVERVSEAGYEEAGVLFRRVRAGRSRRRGGTGSGNNTGGATSGQAPGTPNVPTGILPRGMYLPQ